MTALDSEELRLRLVAVVYILTGGRTDVEVSEELIGQYIRAHRIFQMTKAQFRAHCRPHIEAAQQARGR